MSYNENKTIADPAAAQTDQETRVSSTETRLWSVLENHPGATTAKLARAAGMGRSTAAKILPRWERDSIVTRTEGEKQSAPHTWSIPDSVKTDVGATTPVATGDGNLGASTEGSSEGGKAHSLDGQRAGDTGDHEHKTNIVTAAAAPMVPQRDAQGAQPDQVVNVAVSGDTRRLPKGGLRGLVEDYLADRPGQSFGPAQIGKDLARSGGAVNNALEKLVAQGYAIKTCEAPKRFTHHTTENVK
ncbi:hypothetical protein [Sciscionella marina]|uniref:hypothetical protein n=1 Tax=Sciscionella marina TaxID=508770 RepID=UPI0012F6ED21|nr:hypothetical protein [Sciscionella marina]